MTARQTNDNDGQTGATGGTRGNARERTLSAYEAARDRARDTVREVGDQAAVYPVAAVLGGLAVGAIVGYLIPATRREAELLGATGRRLTAAARDAAQKGVDAGRERIDALAGKAVTKVGAAVAEAVGAKD